MIQFGVMANTHPAPGTDLTRMVDELITEAQQAERSGFDSFFLTEHHQEPSGYFPSPLPLVAALAARTSTIRLGTGIAILPLYHPIRLAEDCAIIDIISKGRLILGVGQGYQEGDFAAFGLKVSDRVSLFEESIEILRRAWTEDKVYFVGKRYTLRNVIVTPKPVQKPHPPIWVAALGDEPMKRAGRLGDALLADSFQLPERLKRRVALYRETAESRGRAHKVVVFREGFVAPTREEAIRQYEAGLLSTHRYYWRHGSYYPDIKKEEDLDLARISLERLILGSPDDCVERIQTWHREVGADYFLIRFRHPGGPAHPKVLEALELFGREVIPRFR
ncbi:MAG TPA: LLM class flavin-dependent oxidoreductase [Candidatus Acidoferrum sp.]|jgi:probable F420-dependent oxidoreductase|nr:LLM class flavin-dependent oxidoreductase [Candidatus Acidoferrum sp.]